MQIRPYQETDQPEVLALWHECGLVVAWNNPAKDIQRKLLVNPELFLVGVLDGVLIATAMAGYEGHRGWVNYLAVAPASQARGYGRLIMQTVEAQLSALGCPKINLQIRSSNQRVIEFYRALGYQVDDVVGMGKRLASDTPQQP